MNEGQRIFFILRVILLLLASVAMLINFYVGKHLDANAIRADLYAVANVNEEVRNAFSFLLTPPTPEIVSQYCVSQDEVIKKLKEVPDYSGGLDYLDVRLEICSKLFLKEGLAYYDNNANDDFFEFFKKRMHWPLQIMANKFFLKEYYY